MRMKISKLQDQFQEDAVKITAFKKSELLILKFCDL